MGVLNFLVSDSTRSYFEFGKVLWEAETTEAMKRGENLESVIFKAIQDPSYNRPRGDDEAKQMAKRAAAWITAHPDWRAVADCDEDFDDIYLAENAEDAAQYKEEFPDFDQPVYTKTGSVWEEQ